MTASFLVVVLAVVAWLLAATALCRELLVHRGRRDTDRYLQWLMNDAVGPLGVVPRPRWY